MKKLKYLLCIFMLVLAFNPVAGWSASGAQTELPHGYRKGEYSRESLRGLLFYNQYAPQTGGLRVVLFVSAVLVLAAGIYYRKYWIAALGALGRWGYNAIRFQSLPRVKGFKPFSPAQAFSYWKEPLAFPGGAVIMQPGLWAVKDDSFLQGFLQQERDLLYLSARLGEREILARMLLSSERDNPSTLLRRAQDRLIIFPQITVSLAKFEAALKRYRPELVFIDTPEVFSLRAELFSTLRSLAVKYNIPLVLQMPERLTPAFNGWLGSEA